MKQSNLKNKPKADAPLAQIPSLKPLRKRQVSFGVFSVEKNPKSETLVIAREPRLRRGERSNLRNASGLLLPPRRDRNDKSVGAWNFKSWHKIFAPESARSKTFTMFQGAWNAIVRCLDKVCGFAILSLVNPPRPKLRLSAGFLYSA